MEGGRRCVSDMCRARLLSCLDNQNETAWLLIAEAERGSVSYRAAGSSSS